MTYKQKCNEVITKVNTHMGYEHLKLTKVNNGFYIVALLNYKGVATECTTVTGYKQAYLVLTGVLLRINWGWH